MITVDDFKSFFTRDFPYLPYYNEQKVYFKGDVVYYNENFYTSLIDSNQNPPSDTESWSFYNDSADSYLSDNDIQKALYEAFCSFPTHLFDDNVDECEGYMGDRNLAMLYLTAFYLVLDLKNAQAGINSNGLTGFTSSKSVGNVSESISAPAWISNNPMYSLYLDNGYGKKYLSLIIPRLTGCFFLAEGGTTWG